MEQNLLTKQRRERIEQILQSRLSYLEGLTIRCGDKVLIYPHRHTPQTHSQVRGAGVNRSSPEQVLEIKDVEDDTQRLSTRDEDEETILRPEASGVGGQDSNAVLVNLDAHCRKLPDSWSDVHILSHGGSDVDALLESRQDMEDMNHEDITQSLEDVEVSLSHLGMPPTTASSLPSQLPGTPDEQTNDEVVLLPGEVAKHMHLKPLKCHHGVKSSPQLYNTVNDYNRRFRSPRMAAKKQAIGIQHAWDNQKVSGKVQEKHTQGGAESCSIEQVQDHNNNNDIMRQKSDSWKDPVEEFNTEKNENDKRQETSGEKLNADNIDTRLSLGSKTKLLIYDDKVHQSGSKYKRSEADDEDCDKADFTDHSEDDSMDMVGLEATSNPKKQQKSPETFVGCGCGETVSSVSGKQIESPKAESSTEDHPGPFKSLRNRLVSLGRRIGHALPFKSRSAATTLASVQLKRKTLSENLSKRMCKRSRPTRKHKVAPMSEVEAFPKFIGTTRDCRFLFVDNERYAEIMPFYGEKVIDI